MVQTQQKSREAQLETDMKKRSVLEQILEGSKRADEFRADIRQILSLVRGWILEDNTLCEIIHRQKGITFNTRDGTYAWKIFWHPADIVEESFVLSFEWLSTISPEEDETLLRINHKGNPSVKLSDVECVHNHLEELLLSVLNISNIARAQASILINLAK